ncbi:hypothetical protein C7476_106194 [Phyllobacterium bourgognense]|uniref:Uncharacterized protein n=1 Tax=Phyllobacterium bourgognense TaxID=314236 RepID=A0A368YSG5_9HYPH|nr:hypothetical protein C7476_106194 [Phyllobacterium bourgognense]
MITCQRVRILFTTRVMLSGLNHITSPPNSNDKAVAAVGGAYRLQCTAGPVLLLLPLNVIYMPLIVAHYNECAVAKFMW